MRARAPLDVDLEDKLLYGLTPIRLGYMVTALLGGFALWTTQWAADEVRGGACLSVIALGAAISWGRWRGRAADGWINDFAVFVWRRYRVTWR